MSPRWTSLALCIILASASTAHSFRVLTVITPGPQSHAMGMKRISEEMQSRGIDVTFLVTDNDAPRLTPTIPAIIYHFDPSSVGAGGLSQSGSLEVKGQQGLAQILPQVNLLFSKAADALFGNSTTMAAVQAFNPDIMLATTMYPAVPILASRLNVSFVNYFPAGAIEPFFTTLYRGSNRRAFLPNPLSYMPQLDLHVTSQRMTYWKRLQNVYTFLRFHYTDYVLTRPIIMPLFRKYGVDLDSAEERRRLVMHIISADPAVEWLRPMTPNARLVGPILPTPPAPLPAELEEFMQSAGEQGVMLVATGTVATLGLRERQAMAAAFAKLPLGVLWRLSKSEVPDEAALAELHLGKNTKVVRWAPQNDVLGHQQTRVFLSHCGANSLYESAYHGVPIVAIPFFADQPGNADKAVAKGFAVRIGHADLLTEALPEAVLRLLDDRRYAQAATMVSVKLRARKRTPVQEAADWVEHALATHGEAYLMTPEDELTFVQRHNIDVIATYLCGAGIALCAVWQLLRWVAAAMLAAATPSQKSKSV